MGGDDLGCFAESWLVAFLVTVRGGDLIRAGLVTVFGTGLLVRSNVTSLSGVVEPRAFWGFSKFGQPKIENQGRLNKGSNLGFPVVCLCRQEFRRFLSKG